MATDRPAYARLSTVAPAGQSVASYTTTGGTTRECGGPGQTGAEHEHPHGLTDRDFEALFTPDKPVVFNFHGYSWLIHRLTYRRPGQHNIHVRGYKEHGNIDTPLELAIRNQTDRFSLAIDAIDRMSRFRAVGSNVREVLLNQQIACRSHAYEFGIDQPEITNWQWPF